VLQLEKIRRYGQERQTKLPRCTDREFITGGKFFDFLRNTIISIGKFNLRVKKYIIFKKIVSNEHFSNIFY